MRWWMVDVTERTIGASRMCGYYLTKVRHEVRSGPTLAAL